MDNKKMDKRIGSILALLLATMLIGALPCRAIVQKLRDPGPMPDLTWRYPAITAPLLAAEPKIDGEVDKREWAGAAQSAPLLDFATGTVADEPAVFWVAYSKDALLIAFRFMRPRYAGAMRSAASTDGKGSVWADDCLEMFITPCWDAPDIYNFVMNSVGARGDGRWEKSVTDKKWSAEWTGAARTIEYGWEGELRIPFSSLGQATPQPGNVWQMQLYHNRKTPSQLLTGWSFMRMWEESMDFGYLRFGDATTPAVRTLNAGELTRESAGVLLEINGGNTERTLAITAELYAPLDAALNYFRKFEDEADPVGAQYTGKLKPEVAPDKATAATLKQYKSIKEWKTKITVPAGGKQTVPLTQKAGIGQYLLHYQIRDSSSGELLAGAAAVFSKTPDLNVTCEPFFLVPKVLGLNCDYKRVEGVTADCRVVAKLGKAGAEALLEEASVPVNTVTRHSEVALPTGGRFGGRYDVAVRLVSGSGQCLAENVMKSYAFPDKPEWWENDFGKVEKLGRVPAPWTAIQITEIRGQRPEDRDQRPAIKGQQPEADATRMRIDVWGREIELNGRLMPVRITHNEVPQTGEPKNPVEMLAGPVVLNLETGGAIEYGPVEKLEDAPWRVVRRVSLLGKGIKGALTLEVEFDGLLKYILNLEPVGATSGRVEKLGLEIPLPETQARYYTYDRFGTTDHPVYEKARERIPVCGLLTREGLVAPYASRVWLGNDTVGLEWVTENDRFWAPLYNKEAIRIAVHNDKALFYAEMVGGGFALNGPARYQWALMPTPAKPMNLEFNHNLYLSVGGFTYDPATKELSTNTMASISNLATMGVNAHYSFAWGVGDPKSKFLWNPDHGKPGLNPSVPDNGVRQALMKKAIRMGHEAGIRWMCIYGLWGGPLPSWPNVNVFWREMALTPLRPTYGGYHYEAGQVFNDWYIWELAKSIRELDIDGVYLDSTCVTRASANPYNGMGWTDEQGLQHRSYPYFANRDLHKRMWILFHGELKTNGLIYAFSDPMRAVIESFVDVHHTGEGADVSWRESLIPQSYGYPFGLPVTWTYWNQPIYPGTRMEAWGSALLLDVVLKTSGVPDQGRTYDRYKYAIKWLWQAFKKYPREGSIWVPPWKTAPFVTLKPEKLKAALHYNKGKAALLVVSNPTGTNIVAEVSVNYSALGFDPAQVTVRDVVLDTLEKPQEGVLKLEVFDKRWRMLYIEAVDKSRLGK